MQFVETNGAALMNGGVPQLEKHLKALEKGGVLFLDEAYQLNPKTNPMGAQVRVVAVTGSSGGAGSGRAVLSLLCTARVLVLGGPLFQWHMPHI